MLSSGFPMASFAQIGINTIPHESTIFDMSQSKKGFLLSEIELVNTKGSEPLKEVKEGVIVFNSTENLDLTKSYYVWNNNQWDPLFNHKSKITDEVSTGIYASVLGYHPKGDGDNAPTQVKFKGIEATKVKNCVKFTDTYADAIEHTYCGYKLKQPIDWAQAFEFSKYLNGYLSVITTTNEWNFLNRELVSIDAATSSNIWIGYNKISEPGNEPEFTWITGEKSTINWSNSSTIQANFQNSPLNNCVYISNNSNKTWNSTSCTATNNYNYVIVEFQK